MLLLITIICAIIGLLIGLVVFLKDSKNPINIWLLAFLVSVCFWVLSTNLLGAYWAGNSVYPIRLPFVFALFMGYSALRFVYHLCNRRIASKVFWTEFVAFATLASLAISPLVMQEGYFSQETGTIVALQRAWAYPVVIVGIALFLIRAMLIIYSTRRNSVGRKKTQLSIVLGGFLIGTVVGFTTNVILPNLTGTVQPARFAAVSLIIFAIVLSYAILRHSFMDIRLAIVRTVGYVLSILGIAVVYVTAVFIITSLFFASQFSLDEQLLYIGIAVVVALSFRSIHGFFAGLTKTIFYHDAYDTKNVLDRLAGLLVKETSTETITRDALEIIHQALRSEFALAIIPGRGNKSPEAYSVGSSPSLEDYAWIRRGRFTNRIILENDAEMQSLAVRQNIKGYAVAMIAKMEVKGKTIGYTLIGYKRNGSAYTQQDSDLMRLAMDELAVALQNALRFEEISQFNVKLEEKVAEATRELRQANIRLRKLDHTKDDFISMASHQLRTPLTSVKGYVSMVLDGDAGQVSESQRKLLMQAFVSSQRMVGLISDLLNVSRLKTGKFVIEPTECDLAKVVDEEASQLQETVSGRGLELTYAKPEHFPTLMLDETKIRQVIMNFIDNAIYYTPSGGHIEVKLVEKPESVEFTVTDDGIGVPRQEQHHLFTKFFRAHNARTARPDGTGLGLFMAKKVIVAQGGAILFKSTPGKGSTFGFTFPKSKVLPQAKFAEAKRAATSR